MVKTAAAFRRFPPGSGARFGCLSLAHKKDERLIGSLVSTKRRRCRYGRRTGQVHFSLVFLAHVAQPTEHPAKNATQATLVTTSSRAYCRTDRTGAARIDIKAQQTATAHT